MRVRAMSGAVGVGLLTGCLLTGCGQEGGTQVEHPEGSVRLVENQPRQMGEVSVVVSAVTGDSAFIGASNGDGPAVSVDVAVGDVVELKGMTFEILGIDEDSSGSSEDGGSNAAVWVLPEE